MNEVDQLYHSLADVIDSINKDMSYVTVAFAVAKLLKEEYGEHNFKPFQEILKNSLTE